MREMVLEYKTIIYDVIEYGRSVGISQMNIDFDAFKLAKKDIESSFHGCFKDKKDLVIEIEEYASWFDEFMGVHMPTFSAWLRFCPEREKVILCKNLDCNKYSEEFILNGERAKFCVEEL